jgi:hypothetical protein
MDTSKQPEERPSPDHAKFAGALAQEDDQAYESANALFGLTQFAAWWIDFKKSYCEGIEASFEIKEGLQVEFLFKRYLYHVKLRYYLKETSLTGHWRHGHFSSDLQAAIWRLRNAEKTARERATFHFNDATAYTNNVSSNVPGLGNPPAKPTPPRNSTP